jgi:hypothetical protein
MAATGPLGHYGIKVCRKGWILLSAIRIIRHFAGYFVKEVAVPHHNGIAPETLLDSQPDPFWQE